MTGQCHLASLPTGNYVVRVLVLQKRFQLTEGSRSTFGAGAFNLLNHPNFGVPSNTQSPLTLGGNGDAIFKDATANLADNVGRIFTTVDTGRQVQLDARFTFQRARNSFFMGVLRFRPGQSLTIQWPPEPSRPAPVPPVPQEQPRTPPACAAASRPKTARPVASRDCARMWAGAKKREYVARKNRRHRAA
jgi:hypothetical protein